MMKEKEMLGPRLGAHMSIAGGPAKAFYRGQQVGCETIQIFTRSPNQWVSRPFTEDEIEDFRQARQETGIAPVMAHSSYLINLGSPDDALWARSLEALILELGRCRQLDVPLYVLHPGSHMGSGEEAGQGRIAAGLQAALAMLPDRQVAIALEITAGQGGGLGHRFEQLAWLIAQGGQDERLGICFDTAHALAAGYEFRDAASYAAMWQSFDALIGLERLWVIHLNDAKRDLGSHVDRHEAIGQGYVGLEAFRLLVNDPHLRHVPMILETPKGPDLAEDVVNLSRLRSLFGKSAHEIAERLALSSESGNARPRTSTDGEEIDGSSIPLYDRAE